MLAAAFRFAAGWAGNFQSELHTLQAPRNALFGHNNGVAWRRAD